MGRFEKAYKEICGQMSLLSTSEGRVSKIGRSKSSDGFPYLEVGRYKYRFCSGFASNTKANDSIRVTVDRLTKSAHFIPVKSTYSTEEYARLYLNEIVRLNEIPFSIISDKGANSLLIFEGFFKRG